MKMFCYVGLISAKKYLLILQEILPTDKTKKQSFKKLRDEGICLGLTNYGVWQILLKLGNWSLQRMARGNEKVWG